MLPFSTLGERFDAMLRMSIPYVVIATFFILNVAALPHPLDWVVKLPLVLSAVYYWSIYRPTLIPAAFVLCLGLLLDLLGTTPLGLNASLLLLVYWSVADQRNFLLGQPYIIIWFGFGIINAITGLVTWLVFGVMNWHWETPLILLPQIIAGFVVFPCLSFILHISHKILPDPKMPLTTQTKMNEYDFLKR
ncbi:MAG: rod shape-determining protein MreD [Bdellovibrionales bacterium]